MLSALALQIGLGLFSVDEEGFESGPFGHLLLFDTSRTVASLHEKLFWVLVGLIVLHIAAVLWYLLVRRDNLVSAMITGRMYPEAPLEQPRMAPRWRSVAVMLVAGASAWLIARGLRL